MKPGSKRVIGAVVVAAACGAAMVEAQGRGGGEWTTSQRRRAARVLGQDRRQAHQGRRAEGRAEVSVEDEARQRDASVELADDAGPDGSVDLAPGIQGARVRRRERRARLRHRYRPGARVLDDDHQLLVDHAAGQQLVGLPRWIDGRGESANGVCRVGVRRRQGRRSRRRIGKLGRRTGQGRAEPRAGLAGTGRGAARRRTIRLPAGRGAAPAAPGAARRGAGCPLAAAVAEGSGAEPNDNIFVVASDGYARTHQSAQRRPTACLRFRFFRRMPGRPTLIAVDGVIYTSTSNGCGAAPNGVWAHRPGQRPEEAGVVEDQWRQRGWHGRTGDWHRRHDLRGRRRSPSGTAAAAGTTYSNAIVALEPKTLKLKDSFTQPGADFNRRRSSSATRTRI